FGDCNEQAEDGCESNLMNDAHNCGVCGQDCAGGLCRGGACQPFPLFAAASVQSYSAARGWLHVAPGDLVTPLVGLSPGESSYVKVGDYENLSLTATLGHTDTVLAADRIYYIDPSSGNLYASPLLTSSPMDPDTIATGLGGAQHTGVDLEMATDAYLYLI